jgi:hypothetical protein
MKEDILNERAQSYQNIYSILTDNVSKAKSRLAKIGEVNNVDANTEADIKIMK